MSASDRPTARAPRQSLGTGAQRMLVGEPTEPDAETEKENRRRRPRQSLGACKRVPRDDDGCDAQTPVRSSRPSLGSGACRVGRPLYVPEQDTADADASVCGGDKTGAKTRSKKSSTKVPDTMPAQDGQAAADALVAEMASVLGQISPDKAATPTIEQQKPGADVQASKPKPQAKSNPATAKATSTTGPTTRRCDSRQQTGAANACALLLVYAGVAPLL
jgi:hypothetical protein